MVVREKISLGNKVYFAGSDLGYTKIKQFLQTKGVALNENLNSDKRFILCVNIADAKSFNSINDELFLLDEVLPSICEVRHQNYLKNIISHVKKYFKIKNKKTSQLDFIKSL